MEWTKTRCGIPAKIVSNNIAGDRPILALLSGDDGKMHPEYYYADGRYIKGAQSNMDLL